MADYRNPMLESTLSTMLCILAGKLMCRYLLRRCDNSPAPWDAGTVGDGPWTDDLPPEATEELEHGQDVHRSKGQPFWDYDKEQAAWRWMRPAPVAAVKTAQAGKPPSLKKEENAAWIFF